MGPVVSSPMLIWLKLKSKRVRKNRRGQSRAVEGGLTVSLVDPGEAARFRTPETTKAAPAEAGALKATEPV